MKKVTFQFPSIEALADFLRPVTTGYFVNTNRCTLTGNFSPADIRRAINAYNAALVQTAEKAFAY